MAEYTIHQDTQKTLVELVNSTFEHATTHLEELHTKMEVVDVMYARYTALKDQTRHNGDGTDAVQKAMQQCSGEFRDLESTFVDVNIPLIVSQVDTAVAYLAELYLSGSPIFPVVSDPQFRKTAEYIETLVDKYSTISGYPKELLMFFKDAMKYNYAPINTEWDVIQEWENKLDNSNLDNAGEYQTRQIFVGYNKIRRLDPYNTIHDMSVLPGDNHKDGEYAGYIYLSTPSNLSALITRLSAMDLGYLHNTGKVFDAMQNQRDHSYWREKPQISHYVTTETEFSWERYFEMAASHKRGKTEIYKDLFEVKVLYRRVRPKAYGLLSPETKGMKEHEYRIYKFIIVNEILLYVQPVYTAYNSLPIMIGSPMEDGFGLQTQSMAESTVPMQKAVSAMTNIRFHSARRAISDRAIYDANAIAPEDVNDANPSAKIAVQTNSLTKGRLADMYYSIPYDSRGTDHVIGDALTIAGWTNELNGLNRAQQGQFQKGNKTREEFSTIMSNADMRQRLPAIMLEFQIFMPLKQMMKMNISRFSEAHKLRSLTSGKEVELDLNTLRSVMFDFRMGDGYTPSSKLASTDLIAASMQLIQSSEILQQQFGPALPNIFAHLMTLGGVKGIDNYMTQPEGTPTDATTPTQPTQPQTGAGPTGPV